MVLQFSAFDADSNRHRSRQGGDVASELATTRLIVVVQLLGSALQAPESSGKPIMAIP